MAELGFKRKLATFLIADIEGYSRLNEWFGATSVYRKLDFTCGGLLDWGDCLVDNLFIPIFHRDPQGFYYYY